MKDTIKQLLTKSITQLVIEGVFGDDKQLPGELTEKVVVTRSRDLSHGDFACNIAMALAKPAGMAPRALAEKIVAALPADKAVAKTEIAGPGFINFYLTSDTALDIIREILEQG